MRRFLALLDKEWRDVRTLAAVVAVFAGGGVFFITWNFRSSEVPAISAQFVLPAMAALFVAMIAADLVAVETQTRRIEAAALLPTRLSTIWTSKAAVLALTGTLFLAWIVACQMAAFLAMRPDDVVVTFTQRLVEETWQLGPVAAAGAAALFFSTVLGRGMPSLVLGLCVGAGVEFAARPVVKALVEGCDPGWKAVGWCGLAVAATLAVAGAAAFTKGRIHCGSRLRRVLVGLSAIALCFVPMQAAFAAWTRFSWLAIEPGDPQASIYAVSCSPDGRHLALTVAKSLENGWVPGACRVWILDVEDGAVHDVGGVRSGVGGWEKDGRLLVRTWSGDGVRESRVDPQTLATEEGDFIPTAALQSRYATSSPKPWYDMTTRTHNEAGKIATTTYVVTWRDRGITATFPSGGVWCSPTPGVVFQVPWQHGALVRHDLETGAARTLAADVPAGAWRLSHDGTRILARIGPADILLDADDGRRLAGPWPDAYASWPSSATSNRFVLLHLRSGGNLRYELVDLTTDERIGIGHCQTSGRGPDVVELPDGRLVVMRCDGQIVLLDAQCGPIRVLYAPRETEN